jgi:hypothetical protein
MSQYKQWLVLPIAVVAVASIGFSLLGRARVLCPEPPRSKVAPVTLPATTSYLPVSLHVPTHSIVALLETAVPKAFTLDVQKDVHVHGVPSRGPITVENDEAQRRVLVSMPLAGRVEVETRLPLPHASVGLDISGGIRASFSPVVCQDQTINPQLGLSVYVDQAVVKTKIGEIGVTELVQGAVGNVVSALKVPVEAQLANAFNGRNQVEHLWDRINSVHKLANEPPTWLRITPRKLTLRQFDYTKDSIASGVALELETHVFVQDAAPEVLKAPLPAFDMAENLAEDFHLSIPVEVSYALINKQLQTQLAKARFNLPDGARLAITSATLEPYGDGILLSVDFDGRKGLMKSVSGRLYIVGVPVFDVATAELRLEQLKYSVATETLLMQNVEWLAHSTVLDAVAAASVVKLNGEMEKAKSKANEALDKLKRQLPKEVGADVRVTELHIDRLAFAKERAFVIVNARGTMSARLQE